MKHPLINEASTHYDNAIAGLEDQLTVDEMIGACKFNIGKYFARLGKKTVKKEARLAKNLSLYDEDFREIEKNKDFLEVAQSDINKIHTYNNYLELLYMLTRKYYGVETVSDAYKQEGISFED